jgi:hypothetical protein
MSKRQQKRERYELRDTMATNEGIRTLWRVLEEAGMHEQSFVPGDPDATAFREGARSIGLWLWDEMQQADAGRLFEFIKQRALNEGVITDDEDDDDE